MANGRSTGNPRPAKIPTERRLTVGSQFYEYPGHQPPRPSKQAPWLRMGGHWLAAAGFNIQAPVRVRVMPGCLVLTVEQAEQESAER